MPTVKGNINNGSNRFAIGTAGKEMQVYGHENEVYNSMMSFL